MGACSALLFRPLCLCVACSCFSLELVSGSFEFVRSVHGPGLADWVWRPPPICSDRHYQYWLTNVRNLRVVKAAGRGDKALDTVGAGTGAVVR